MLIPEPTSIPKCPIIKSKKLSSAERTNLEESFNTYICGIGTAVDIEFMPITTTSVIENYKLTVDDCYRPRQIEELHNCHNCGGGIDEKGYCKYCGSRVYYFG